MKAKLLILFSLLGIFLLLLLSLFLAPKEVNSYQELRTSNYVKTSGKIISIREVNDFRITKLNNNITVTSNFPLSLNQTVEITGRVSEYQGTLQINAEKIKIR